MSYFERVVYFYLRRIVLGGIDVLRQRPYIMQTLSTIFSVASITLLLVFDSFSIDVSGFTSLVLRLSLAIALTLVLFSLPANYLKGTNRTVVFFFILILVIALIIPLNELLFPFLGLSIFVTVINEFFPLLSYYIWLFILASTIFSLVVGYFTSWVGRVFNAGRPQNHFLFAGPVKAVVLVSGLPYFLMVLTSRMPDIIFDGNALLSSFIGSGGLDFRSGIPGLELLSGLLGIISWIIVMYSTFIGPKKPNGSTIAEILGYFYIYNLIHTMIFYQAESTSSAALTVVLTTLGLLYAVQALTTRLTKIGEKKKKKSHNVGFITVLLGLALGYFLQVVSIIQGVALLHQTFFHTFSFIFGSSIIIVVFVRIMISQSYRQNLLNTPTLQNAISGIMTLLTQEEIMSLVSEVAVATVEGTKRTARGFMDSILNRFRPEDQE